MALAHQHLSGARSARTPPRHTRETRSRSRALPTPAALAAGACLDLGPAPGHGLTSSGWLAAGVLVRAEHHREQVARDRRQRDQSSHHCDNHRRGVADRSRHRPSTRQPDRSRASAARRADKPAVPPRRAPPASRSGHTHIIATRHEIDHVRDHARRLKTRQRSPRGDPTRPIAIHDDVSDEAKRLRSALEALGAAGDSREAVSAMRQTPRPRRAPAPHASTWRHARESRSTRGARRQTHFGEALNPSPTDIRDIPG